MKKFNKRIKQVISLVVALSVLVTTLIIPVSADSSSVTTEVAVIDGITYTIEKTVESDGTINVVVTNDTNSEVAEVTNDGDTMEVISTDGNDVVEALEIDLNATVGRAVQSRFVDEISTPFWGYSARKTTDPLGLICRMHCPDRSPSTLLYLAWDDTRLITLSREYYSWVSSIKSAQINAGFELASAAVSAVAALITAKSAASVIAILGSVGLAIVGAHTWYVAWAIAQDANECYSEIMSENGYY